MSQLRARSISEADHLDVMMAGDSSALLSAYVRAEQMHVFRRLLWRRLALFALVWVTVAAASSFISPIGVVAGLSVLAVGAAGVLWLEWQAGWALQVQLRKRTVDHDASFITRSAGIVEAGRGDRLPRLVDGRGGDIHGAAG